MYFFRYEKEYSEKVAKRRSIPKITVVKYTVSLIRMTDRDLHLLVQPLNQVLDML